jgi:hypothetical protein
MWQENIKSNAELHACCVHVTYLWPIWLIALKSHWIDMTMLYHLYRLFSADEHVTTATFMAEN